MLRNRCPLVWLTLKDHLLLCQMEVMERQNLQCQQAQNYHLNDVSKQSNDFALDVVFNVVFEFIVPEV